MQIHEKIRLLRKAKGLTQEQMAEKLNITSVAYSNIERGESGILIKRLEEIAAVMNVDLLELLNTGEKNIIIFHESNHNSTCVNQILEGNESLSIEMQKLTLIIQQQQKEIDYLKQQNLDLRQLIDVLRERKQ